MLNQIFKAKGLDNPVSLKYINKRLNCINRSLIAQPVEQVTVNHWVASSSLAQGA